MRKFGFLYLLASLFSTTAAAEEVVPAYNPYQAVPFIVADGGLAADLIGYMNGKLKGKYQFKLMQVTRDALNKNVLDDADFKGAVLFQNPFFVADTKKTKYFWSQALMADSNVVISSGTRKLEYTGPAALNGLKFGGIAGNRYANLEDQFGKAITREDVAEELLNSRKVVAGKVDVTIMSGTTYRFLSKQIGKEAQAKENLYTSSKPHSEFDVLPALMDGDSYS